MAKPTVPKGARVSEKKNEEGLMRIPILVAIGALSTSLMVIGIHTLVVANPVDDMTDSVHKLAVACYSEGFQKGRIAELADRLREKGILIPARIQKDLMAEPTAGCRQ